MHDYQDLIDVFHNCFFENYNTLLVKGGDEPIYFPAGENRPHAEIVFARGFFASALHEIAHWLIAGEQRRKLEDYGYWYEPDGRDVEKQALFEKVEVKPQAIEWILSKASGFKFRVSNDNLNNQQSNGEAFKKQIYHQVLIYLQKGLPSRVQTFQEALSCFYGTKKFLEPADFSLEDLQ